MGAEVSEAVPLQRGLPQGGPESPLICTLIVDMLMRRLEDRWRGLGWGFRVDGEMFFSVA